MAKATTTLSKGIENPQIAPLLGLFLQYRWQNKRMVKQIDRRTKISGAQWKRENVPQVLAHRAAYLNGLLSV